jgi:hypothetical protein
MTKDETQALLLNAMGLLLDRNLDWSADFNNIRPALCMLLHESLIATEPNEYALLLAEKLIDTHG